MRRLTVRGTRFPPRPFHGDGFGSTILRGAGTIPTTMHPSNLFESIPANLPEELVEVLAEGRGHVRIVRLVSQGHASVPGFWYDQAEDEWVALLSGRALLSFEDSATGEVRAVALGPGDWLHIPPHARHRVESTDPDTATVWLAVHWG